LSILTIGIPVYNKANFIVNCINSALKVNSISGKDLCRIVVVDDCSTDNSLELIQSKLYNFDLVSQVISLPYNEGVSFARNCIIENTCTKYLTFLDADDILEPIPIIDLIYNYLQPTCDYDLLLTNIQQFSNANSDSKVLSPISTTKALSSKELVDCIINYLDAPNRNGLLAQCFGKIYNLEFLKDNNLKFNIGQHNYEDVAFVASVLGRNPKTMQVKTIFYKYITYSLGTTESYGSKRPLSSHFAFLVSIPLLTRSALILLSYVDSNKNMSPNFLSTKESNAISILTFITIVCHAHRVRSLKSFFSYYHEVCSIFDDGKLHLFIKDYNPFYAPGGSPLLTWLIKKKLYFPACILSCYKFKIRYGYSGSTR